MELQERENEFNKGLEDLKAKYGFVIGAQAGITPDGRIIAKAVLMESPKETAPLPTETPKAITE